MTSTVAGVDALAALAAFEAAVDGLLASDLGALDDEALLDRVRRAEVQRRRLAASDARDVAEVDARGLAHERGARDTASLLALMLRIDPAEAKARAAAARDFSSRRALSGELLEPTLPQVAAALQAGEIHPRQAAVIASTIDKLPLDVQATQDRQIEAQLVDEARRFAPFQLARIAERLRYHYDQDGTFTDDADRERRRELNYRRLPDGSMDGDFHLDPTTAEAFETVIDAQLANLSAERRRGRTPAQLRHDALRDLIFLMLRTDALASTAGVTTTVVIHISLDQWIVLLTLAGIASGATGATNRTAATRTVGMYVSADEGAAQRANVAADERADENGERDGPARRRRRRPPGEWLAVTNHGAFLTLNEVAPLLGDAQTLPVVLSTIDGIKKVEAYGDKHRIFTENQRLAMAARDQGCTFPGCTSTPAYCEAHHVIDYADGGPTSVSNGALICAYHHRTFEQLGYACVMVNGAPHWIPPTWIDPARTPQRNTAHDTRPAAA